MLLRRQNVNGNGSVENARPMENFRGGYIPNGYAPQTDYRQADSRSNSLFKPQLRAPPSNSALTRGPNIPGQPRVEYAPQLNQGHPMQTHVTQIMQVPKSTNFRVGKKHFAYVC